MTPEEYPAECSISDDEYSELKEALTSNENWKSYTEEWPPTDSGGNAYPLWFTVDDLNGRGELIDSFNNNYNPFAGTLEPEDDHCERCNAPLKNWRERYPNIRFCGQILDAYDGDYTYCAIHKGRENVTKTAEEHMQTGLHVKSLDHLYEKLSAWKKLVGWGTFESLMGESNYEFGEEYDTKEFDFSEETFAPDDADEDGILEVDCGYPTQYNGNALYLYVAAMQTVQMITVQPKIMYEDEDEGQGMMETRSIETAQLTSPTEHDTSQDFKTIETWSEHHLNLPMSRLIKDQPRLLELGGVNVDPESESDTAHADDIVLEIEADPDNVETKEDTGTDPNALGDDYTGESEKILDSTGEDSNSKSSVETSSEKMTKGGEK